MWTITTNKKLACELKEKEIIHFNNNNNNKMKSQTTDIYCMLFFFFIQIFFFFKISTHFLNILKYNALEGVKL
jgi:hypothetical protein